MTHPMLEKVARAIAANNRLLWEALEPASQQSYLRAARAAIQALLEPKQDMIEAGRQVACDEQATGGVVYSTDAEAKAIYRAMLLRLVEGDEA